jgi:hypothetical protein
MKLSFKTILPILSIFTLLILFAGCGTTPSPGYTLGTECINTVPKVSTIPRQAISAGYVDCIPTYELTVSSYASDNEGNNLTYSFVGSVPTGMDIDENSGKIFGWVPYCSLDTRCHQCGDDRCITVRVQDDGCCQPSYTDVTICIEVWWGTIDGNDGGTKVGIGFDGAPFEGDFCLP